MKKENLRGISSLSLMGRSLLLLLLFLGTQSVSTTLYAQAQRKVMGVVTDNKGESIPGVNVLVKGTTIGAITDLDGNYSITVPDAKSVLLFTFVGYETQEITVGNQKTINVKLLDDTQALDEVVVVGYGTQKKATLTGAVSSVKGENLKAAGVANVTNTFAGRLPGVIATNRTGEPGADFSTIYIRGKGSLNDNSPLIVIDGVANRNGLDRLNPSDIESVNVLKDASAAIYGAQAANGVILVTTKRGSGDKPTITYNGTVSMAQHTRTPKLLNAYEYMNFTDEIRGYNGWDPKFDKIKEGYLDGSIDRNQYGDTDWMDATFSNFAPQTRHSLSVSGGSEKVKYYISGDFSYQKPNYRNTVFNYQTAQLRSNIDAQVTKDLKVGLDLSGRKESNNKSIYSTGTMFWEAFNAHPYLYDYYPNGLPGPGLADGNNLAILAAGEETGYDRIADYYADTKISFDLQMPWITKGLSLSGYAAFDFRFYNEKKFWDVWDTYNYNGETKEYDKKTTNMDGNNINLNQEANNSSTTTLHFKLGYDRAFGDHSVGAFVAYEQSQYSGENLWAWRGYYMSSNPDYLDFGLDKDKTNGGKGYATARQNIFGRLNYAYKGKYMAEFTMRYDGSMNFLADKRWGTFPGVSVGWRLSEEKFMQEAAPFVNDLKLRASWGKLGNDRSYDLNVIPKAPIYYQYLSTFNMVNGPVLGDDYSIRKGFTPGRIGNPDITWEKVDSKNIAIDGTLWNGLLSFTAEYFYQNRTDILTPKQASIPEYTGLTLPDQNIGEVSNQGMELMLNHRNKVGDFTYNVGGNFTYTKNNIKFFDEAANVPEWQKRTGHSMDTWLMYKTDGIYQTWDEIESSPHLAGTQPGDIKYVDIDESGSITDNDRIRSEYANIPRIVYGINMGVEWKGWELNMLWTGQAQAEQMIVPYSYNTHQEFYDNRWTSAEATPNSKYPRAFDKDDAFNTKWSDFWLYDASFIRLKNVEIAYTLPSRWTQRAKMQNVRFYIAGNNLVTFDKIKFQDPESNATSSGQYYPQARTYTFGVNLSF